MNTVDREVIRDLLPLYRAGLASPQSRALVEQHLAADPELMRELKAAAKVDERLRESELEAFSRSRTRIRRLRWLFGLAIGFTVLALPLRVQFDANGVSDVHLLAMEAPLIFLPLLVLAAACWTGYFLLKRR